MFSRLKSQKNLWERCKSSNNHFASIENRFCFWHFSTQIRCKEQTSWAALCEHCYETECDWLDLNSGQKAENSHNIPRETQNNLVRMTFIDVNFIQLWPKNWNKFGYFDRYFSLVISLKRKQSIRLELFSTILRSLHCFSAISEK